MSPVLKLDKSYSLKLDNASSAINIVGTPWRAVAFSSSTAFKAKSGSKPSLG